VRVAGLRFRIQGSGFRVQGLGFRVQDSGSRALDSGFRVQTSGFRWCRGECAGNKGSGVGKPEGRSREREFLIDNLLFQIQLIIEMILVE
jgi:hypothetical protein